MTAGSTTLAKRSSSRRLYLSERNAWALPSSVRTIRWDKPNRASRALTREARQIDRVGRSTVSRQIWGRLTFVGISPHTRLQVRPVVITGQIALVPVR